MPSTMLGSEKTDEAIPIRALIEPECRGDTYEDKVIEGPGML